MKSLVRFIVFSAILFGSGCQAISPGTQAPGTIATTVVAPTQGEIKMTPFVPTPADSGLQTLIETIREDLASRLAVPTDEISLMELTEVEWTDSSMDCPQPGMSYLQVITPGYKIVFQVNDQSYEYHTNREAAFVYCEDQIPPMIPKP